MGVHLTEQSGLIQKSRPVWENLYFGVSLPRSTIIARFLSQRRLSANDEKVEDQRFAKCPPTLTGPLVGILTLYEMKFTWEN